LDINGLWSNAFLFSRDLILYVFQEDKTSPPINSDDFSQYGDSIDGALDYVM
jgi:hypothetical protein